MGAHASMYMFSYRGLCNEYSGPTNKKTSVLKLDMYNGKKAVSVNNRQNSLSRSLCSHSQS